MQQFDLITGTFTEKAVKRSKVPVDSLKTSEVGCRHCPLDKVPNIRKVIGLKRIEGKRAMVWAQSPGATENAHGKELIGPVGKFLWKALEKEGISRSDVDIQNVLRCRPADRFGNEHPPTKEELHCCSIYNHKALELNDGKAQVHLVLGQVAGARLLGRSFHKDSPIMWHAPWNAYVVFNNHPSYVLRSGGEQSGWPYEEFCLRLHAVKSVMQNPGRWGYVLSRPYVRIQNEDEAENMFQHLMEEDVIAIDIEVGNVEDKDKVLQVTFGWGNYEDLSRWDSWKGNACVVVLDHPENTMRRQTLTDVKRLVKQILEHKVAKVAHHGSYEDRRLKELMGISLKGYREDSQYAAYLKRPNLREYGLHPQTQKCFTEFCDYKLMTEGYTNFAEIPLPTLVPYGCADADLSLRIYRSTCSEDQKPLLRVYTRAAVTLDAMEGIGPYLDYKALERINDVIPKQAEAVRDQLCIAAGNPKFNPNAPAQVAELLYDQLNLPEVEGRKTGAEVLQILTERTGNPVPGLIGNFRYLFKAKSTYIDGYRKSADLHDGQLRTRWHLTGAATGRLRSGGGGKEGGIVNFQNFHGNALLKNMLVSDPLWRRVLDLEEADILNVRTLLAFDYSQIEIRMLAEITEDPLLIQQFNSGMDIHCLVGHELTGWPVEKIAKNKEVRRLVKNLHFGVVYGISQAGLYDYLIAKGVKNVSQAKASKLHTAYFAKYKKVAKWIQKQRNSVESLGYVENLFHFRRPIGAWDDSRNTYWGNQSINTPIQGSAHTLLLVALALLKTKPRTYNLLQTPVMEIHDALDFYVPLHQLQDAIKQGTYLLETGVRDYVEAEFGHKFQVPLLVEAEAGFCLGSQVGCNADTTVDGFLKQWRVKHKEVEEAAWEKLLPSSGN